MNKFISLILFTVLIGLLNVQYVKSQNIRTFATSDFDGHNERYGFRTNQTFYVHFVENNHTNVSWIMYENGSEINRSYTNNDFHRQTLSKSIAGEYTYTFLINNYFSTEDVRVNIYAPLCSGQWNDVRSDSELEMNSTGTKIYYINDERKVANLYKSGSNWYDAVLNPSAITAENGRGLAYNKSNGEIYYVGNNNKIYAHYYSHGWKLKRVCTGQWNNVHSNSELVMNQYGTKIFYINTNRDVCVLWKSGSTWYDSKLSNTGYKAENGRGLTYCASTGEVFYTGDNNKIYRYYYSNGAWQNQILRTNQYYLTRWESELEVNSTGTKIFYINYQGRVCNLYKSGSNWYEGVLNTSARAQKTGSNFTYYDGNLIYIGNDHNTYKLYYSSGWKYAKIRDGQIETEHSLVCYGDNVYFSERSTDHIYKYSLSSKKSGSLKPEETNDISVNNFTEEPNIEIYPNPTNGIFKVSNIEEAVQLEIIDYTGRVIFRNEEYSGEEIDLSNQVSGIYLTRIRMNNQYITKKLMLNN